MKTLSDLFVPIKHGDMVEPVFFGGIHQYLFESDVDDGI